MIGLNKKDYSLKLSRNIMSLLQRTKAFQEANSDIIEITYPNGSEILLTDKDKQSTFQFQIAKPSEVNEISLFQLRISPENEKGRIWEGAKDFDTLFIKLEEWISLIKGFNDISYTQEDALRKAYDQEFYSYFEIVDEDADIAPFDLPKQLLLDQILADISSTLVENSSSYDVHEIIEETNHLRLELHTSTKKVVIKKFGKILSLVRLKGLPLLKEVLKEIVKDKIKDFINGKGADMIKYLHDNIHLLQ